MDYRQPKRGIKHIVIEDLTDMPTSILKIDRMRVLLIIFLLLPILPKMSLACSVLYYVDAKTGKIYVVNSEDYWLDVDAYIQIEPSSKKAYARLWYGWDNFAQGGINEQGLFFDAAVTPEQERIKGYGNPKNNLGDRLLASCSTVQEALDFLEKEKIALNDSHMMFGDNTGKAVVVEWVEGERKLHWIKDNKLIMTNYLLSAPSAGNYPCYRFESIEERIEQMEENGEDIDLLKIGNTFGLASQPAKEAEDGRIGGTVYTSFIDITDNKFVLVYRLSNESVIKLDLEEEFSKSKKQKIKLKK